MYDDRPLVDLITSRFDDLISRVDDFKKDVLRGQDKHELDDKERFEEHHARLTGLEKAHWKQVGMVSVVNVIAFAVWTYFFGS